MGISQKTSVKRQHDLLPKPQPLFCEIFWCMLGVQKKMSRNFRKVNGGSHIKQWGQFTTSNISLVIISWSLQKIVSLAIAISCKGTFMSSLAATWNPECLFTMQFLGWDGAKVWAREWSVIRSGAGEARRMPSPPPSLRNNSYYGWALPW